METHAKRKKDAFDAADRLHADQSVPLQQTWDDLSELREHVEMLMDAVTNSMPDDEFGKE
jgi:hypothetical protein